MGFEVLCNYFFAFRAEAVFELRMDTYGAFCVEVCCQDAEAEFFKEFFSGGFIDVFEVLNSLLYSSLYWTVLEALDISDEVVHTRSALERVYGKTR